IGNYASASEGYSAALGGFIVAGLVFTVLAIIIKFAGTRWIDTIFPPAAMGAIIAVIGLELVPTAARMAGWIAPEDAASWTMDPDAVLLSIITLTVTILGSVLFRGFMRIIPILVGIVTGYVAAALMGLVKFDTVANKAWLDAPT